MKLLVIDKKAQRLEIKGALLYSNERKIPLRLIDTLIVARSDAIVSAKTLLKLGEANIFTLFTDDRQRVVLAHSHRSHNAELKLSQYRAALSPLPLAKTILATKIRLHAKQLRIHDVILAYEDLIAQIDGAETTETLLGIEGAFSRRYFGYYFSLLPKTLHGGKRSKQPPKDPVNAMLSYYYTLFYHLIAIRLYGYGFEPAIGFLHKPFRAHFALASDMMEFCRAEINEEVYRLFHEKVLSKSDFSKRGEGVYLRYEARTALWKYFRKFYASQETQIDKQIATIRRML